MSETKAAMRGDSVLPSLPASRRVSAFLRIGFFGGAPLLGYLASLVILPARDVLYPVAAHSVLVGIAVLLNLFLQGWLRRLGGHPRVVSVSYGFVAAVAGVYALALVPAVLNTLAVIIGPSGLAPILLLVLCTVGFVPAAPYVALLGLWVLASRVAALRAGAGVSPWRFAYPGLLSAGVALGVVAFLRVADPWHAESLVRLAIALREGDRARVEALASRVRSDRIGPQLEACRQGIDTTPARDRYRPFRDVVVRGNLWFLARSEGSIAADLRGQSVLPVELCDAFQYAHGIEPPASRLPHGLPAIEWLSSRFDVRIDPIAALARVDWIAEVTTPGRRDAEAVFDIELPLGAVASGLSLWIEGEERPAAFASGATVAAAYAKFAVPRSDPALLTEIGPQQLRLRIFPLRVDLGPRRTKVRFTIPLRLGEADDSLQLPLVRGDRFVRSPTTHFVAVDHAGSVRHRDCARIELARPIAFPKVAAIASALDELGPLHQRLLPREPLAPPASAIVVLEASRTARYSLGTLSQVLGAFSAQRVCTFFVATATGVVELQGNTADPDLARSLDAIPCPGGVLALPALESASSRAKTLGTRVLWLHGDGGAVPPAMVTDIPLDAANADVEILAVPLSGGIHRTKQLPALAPRVVTLRAGATAAENLAGLRAWLRSPFDIHEFHPLDVQSRRFDRSPFMPIDAVRVDEQLARLFAAHEARRLHRAGDAVAGARLAAANRLVTAGAGAVVLEQSGQYQEFGLSPGAASGHEPRGSIAGAPVPEPGTCMLLAIGGFVVTVSRGRRRLVR